MPTVRKIANPDAPTTDDRRPTTDDQVAANGHNAVRRATVDVGELPSGWAWSTLGAISAVNARDGSLRNLPDNMPVTFVPMVAVHADSGLIQASEERTLGAVRKGYTSFSEGDVIFAK